MGFSRLTGGNRHNSWHWVSSRLCHFSFFLEVLSPTLSSFLLCMYWSFSATHPRRSLCRSLEFSPQLSSPLCSVLQTIAALFSPDSQPHLTQLKEFSCVPPPCPMDWKLSKGSVQGSHRVYLTCFSFRRDHIMSNVIWDHTQGLISSVFKTIALYFVWVF